MVSRALLALMMSSGLFLAACSSPGETQFVTASPKPRNLTLEDSARLKRLRDLTKKPQDIVPANRADIEWLLILAHQEREKLRLSAGK